MNRVQPPTPAKVRPFRVSPLRAGFAVLLTVVAGLLFLLVVDAAIFLQPTLARIAFPWADNQWSDGPIIVQLYRLEHGGPAYAPAHLADSFDYGPVYIYLLFALRRVLGLAFSSSSYRAMSASIGLLSIVPLGICATLIARSLGLRRARSASMLIVLCTTALLSFAVLSRNITFDALHPDTLLALLASCSLALYYALAMRLVDGRFIWALAAIGTLMIFTKQNSFMVFPLLGLALWRTGALSAKLWLASFAAFVAISVLALDLMPADMREWTFQVPGSHPYETHGFRLSELWLSLTDWQLYIGLELAVFAVVVVLLARRRGSLEYVVHGAPAAATVLMALSAYFKVFGVFNNLSFIALFSAPYCAALTGMLTTPRFVTRAKRLAVVGSVILLFAVGRSLHEATRRDVAGQTSIAQMSAAESTLRELCARQKVLVTFNPDFFFGCKNAHFSLFFSYAELYAGRNRHRFGLTIFDRPTSYPYVVDTNIAPWAIPKTWQRKFHIERELPAVLGFEDRYLPVNIRIWARNSL
jgi:hypothetical protein